jgi:hypothetical protein
MRYPFDTHTSKGVIAAAYKVFNKSTILPLEPCIHFVDPSTDPAPHRSLRVQQSLTGWHVTALSPVDQSGPFLQITVERSDVLIGLACLLFAGWSFERPLPSLSV